MTAPAISRFPVPSLKSMPNDIRERILAVQEKSGFVPNVFLVLAHRPDEFRAFFAYHDALMEKDGGLTKAEREMIVVATSDANQCHYCVVAHGAILRIRAKNPAGRRPGRDQLPQGGHHRPAEGDAGLRDEGEPFGAYASPTPIWPQLKKHGFKDDDVWDITAIAAFFALSNRMANVTSMRPNDEFYLMGRLPKQG